MSLLYCSAPQNIREDRPETTNPATGDDCAEALATESSQLGPAPLPPIFDFLEQETSPPKHPPLPPSTGNAIFTALQKRDSGYASLLSLPFSLTPRSSNATIGPSERRSDVNFFDKPIPPKLQVTFHDFRLLFSRRLWEAVSKKKASPANIAMKLKYMGKTETDAELFIVVHCERERARRVKKFFAQDPVRECLGADFKVCIIPIPPLQLAGSASQIEVYRASIRSETLCGTSIQMKGGASSVFTTLGGLLEISKDGETTICGLTAGHSPQRVHQTQLESQESVGNGDAVDDGDDSDDSDCVLGEDDDFVQILEPSVGPAVPIYADERLASDQLPYLFGTIHNSCGESPTVQTQNGNRDWALVSIPADQWLPNRIYNLHLSIGQAGGRLSPPKQVAVLTSRGPQRGKMVTNCSAVIVPPGEDFVNTLGFSPAAGSSTLPNCS